MYHLLLLCVVKHVRSTPCRLIKEFLHTNQYMTNQMFNTSAFPAQYTYKYIYIPPCASAVLCVTLCYNDNAVTTDNPGLEVWLDMPQPASNHISFADHLTPRFLVAAFGKASYSVRLGAWLTS